jgi:hypothetical protein
MQNSQLGVELNWFIILSPKSFDRKQNHKFTTECFFASKLISNGTIDQLIEMFQIL